MRATLESTTKIVTLNGIPARVWQGQTESGIQIHCFIARVAVANENAPEVFAEFERELKEQATPRSELDVIPLRMII